MQSGFPDSLSADFPIGGVRMVKRQKAWGVCATHGPLHLCVFASNAPCPLHRSHSPITKSSEPRMAVVSLSKWPGISRGKMLRLQNDGERILSR